MDPIEASTRDGVFVFDRRILEIFAMDGSQRFHQRFLPQLWIDGEFLYVRRQDHTTLPWIFDAGQRDDLDKLVAAVGAASTTV